MQFEIWAYRGLRLAIDGVEPAIKGWSVGELDNGWSVGGPSGIGGPLRINGRNLVRVEMDKTSEEVMENCQNPTKVILHFVTDDGVPEPPVELSVVTTASDRHVTTVSGKVEQIDEITYYVRAATSDVEAASEFKDPLDEVANWTVTIKFPWMRKREVIEMLQEVLETMTESDYEITKE